ncbi:DUF4362 domain-containing protein [Actinoplanes sp. NPDC049596]|uniref:DUF4362 domain-containing protein n=1 Tax=unclassified Actinoplanes TaxID=2626549 RepID=UPI003417E8BF
MKTYVVVPLLLVALVAGGCTEPGTAPPDVLKMAPSATVADCGTFTLDQGEQLAQDAGLCLLGAARKGQIARLQVSSPTVEGDPIITVFATRPDGSVEVVEDTRQDAYGPQEITHEICTGPALGPDGLQFGQCGP